MRRVNVSSVAIFAGAASLVMQLTIAPAQAAPVTYQYTGNPFTFCGFGCPGQEGEDSAPANWRDDFIKAWLTFAAPLAPNLTPEDDVLPGLTAWTVTDNLGTFLLSSAAGHVLGFEGNPPLLLSTDSSGDIVNYLMTATDGFTNSEGDLVGTGVGLAKPTVACEGCGEEVVLIADFLGFNVRRPGEWNAISSTPGQWTTVPDPTDPVPEPATLTLVTLGLAGVVARHRRRSRSAS